MIYFILVFTIIFIASLTLILFKKTYIGFLFYGTIIILSLSIASFCLSFYWGKSGLSTLGLLLIILWPMKLGFSSALLRAEEQ